MVGSVWSANFQLTRNEEMICRLTSDLNQFGFFTRPTLAAFDNMIPLDTEPLSALIHEPIYARGYD